MTNNTRSALSAVLLLLAMLVLSCTQDTLTPESKILQPQDFKLSDARSIIENRAGNIDFPQLLLPILTTKSIGTSFTGNLSPIWDEYHIKKDVNSYIYEIPLLYNLQFKAFLYEVTQDKRIHIHNENVKLQSNLVIQKFKESDSVRFFVSTIIGNSNSNDNIEENDNPWLWSGEIRDFEGYQFFTSLNGDLKAAYHYIDGTRKQVKFTVHDPRSSKEKIERKGFGFLLGNALMTKGYTECPLCYTRIDGGNECPICGYLLDETIIIEEGYVMCDNCYKPTHLCECPDCTICFSDPCICPNPFDGLCPFCFGEYCSGECINMGGGAGNPNPGGNKYIVDVTCIGNGSVSGLEQPSYEPDSWVKIVAKSGPGSVFGGWKNQTSGAFLSISSTLELYVDSHKTIIAYFYEENSECGKLVKKYKSNGNLEALVQELENFMTNNDNLEHAVLRTIDGEYSRILGEEDNVKFTLMKNKNYEYMIHNHPSGTLIPSPEDLYTIYKADSANIYSGNRCFLIKTDSGMLSIEIEDALLFRTFVEQNIGLDNLRYHFSKSFYRYFLNKPTKEEMKTLPVLDSH